MAETIAKLVIKKTDVSDAEPAETFLDYGELAINYTDGKLYFKNNLNEIRVIGQIDTVNTSDLQTLANKTLSSPIINVGSDMPGDLYYRNAGGVFTRLPIGSADNVLKVTAGMPAWGMPSGGVSAAVPTISDFSTGWINQGTNIASDTTEGLLFSAMPGTIGVGMLLKPLSDAAEWSYIAKIKLSYVDITGGADYDHCGLFLRDSISGKALHFCFQLPSSSLPTPRATRMQINGDNSYNSESSPVNILKNGWTPYFTDTLFMRLRKTGSNIEYDISISGGQTWVNVSTNDATSWITPTHVGIGGDCLSANPIEMLLMNWSEF